MKKIEIISGTIPLLERVEVLWRELKKHHVGISTHFSTALSTVTYEQRKENLINTAKNGVLLVEIAIDQDLQQDVGYCISAVNAEKKGEIESIFVRENYRGTGIGDQLLKRAVDWLDDMQVTEKVVAVVYGNEEVFSFYKKYGFYPRVTLLKQKSP